MNTFYVYLWFVTELKVMKTVLFSAVQNFLIMKPWDEILFFMLMAPNRSEFMSGGCTLLLFSSGWCWNADLSPYLTTKQAAILFFSLPSYSSFTFFLILIFHWSSSSPCWKRRAPLDSCTTLVSETKISISHRSANTVLHICALAHLFTHSETQHGPKIYVFSHMFTV